jgi:hypothetical protein
MNWFSGTLRVYMKHFNLLYEKPLREWDGISFATAQEIVAVEDTIEGMIWMYTPYEIKMGKN